jgi:hypothetical protein
MTTFSASRRKWLIGGAAGVLALGTLGAGSWSRLANGRAAWIEQVVRDNLPGIDLDADSMKSFVDYLLTTERMQRGEVKATIVADRFIPWLPAQVAKARNGLEGLERYVLTEYLTGSNFFRVADPRREKIAYNGPQVVCTNPFMYS